VREVLDALICTQ